MYNSKQIHELPALLCKGTYTHWCRFSLPPARNEARLFLQYTARLHQTIPLSAPQMPQIVCHCCRTLHIDCCTQKRMRSWGPSSSATMRWRCGSVCHLSPVRFRLLVMRDLQHNLLSTGAAHAVGWSICLCPSIVSAIQANIQPQCLVFSTFDPTQPLLVPTEFQL